ncbi:hypothetical protein [Runella sp.]|uniref:hypothetical protein n=1 Tax=Runella sp. TaxID=1960881 RepID=UPI003D0F9B54
MNHYITLFLLFAICSSCTRKANDNSKPTAIPIKLVTHKDAIDSLRKDTTAPLQSIRVTNVSAEKTAAFFGNHDLALLLHDPSIEGGYANRFDGFYGDDHYRIELFFSDVKRDSLQPNVYHVIGKDRFKKTITPFEGTITFTKLATFKDPNLNEEHYEHDEFELKEAYTTEANFEFKENEATKGSGIFSGKMLMDFFERKDGQIELWYFSTNAPAQASGFKFEGSWTNYKKTMTKPVVWARDLFAFANNILTDFSIGEREVEINKKYRHLGWENYWENDEWWHDSTVIQ